MATAYVVVSPDTEGFAEELKAKLDEATAGAEGKVKIGLDTADFDAKADEVKAKADALDGKRASVKLSADSADLDAKTDDAKAKVDALGAKRAAPKLSADDAEAQAKIDELKAKLDRLKLEKQGIKIDADASAAEIKIAQLQAQIEALKEESSSGFSLGSPSMPGGMMGGLATGLAALAPGIGGAATGLGLLGGTGALAFGGIATALSAAHQSTQNLGMTSAQVAATQFGNSVQIQQAQQQVGQAHRQAANDAVSSAQAIQQADMSLAETERNTAASQIQAIEAVAQAKQGVEQANYGLTEAEYNLGQAWVQARENLQSLNDQLNDSKLSVKAASLAVQQAEYQQRLTDQNAYSTSIQKQQAALAVAQAQQQVIDATHREADAATAANLANKQGVAGSQTVIQAKQGVVAAQYQQQNAAKSYADAQRNLTNTELNNAAQVKAAQMQAAAAQRQAAYTQQSDAIAIGNAQQNLTNTIKQQQLQWAATMSTQNQAANQFARDMARLTPAGRGFVDAVLAMRPAFKGLESIAQNTVLPGMTIWLNGVKSLLPEVSKGIGGMGTAMSNAFAAFGKQMATPQFAQVLNGLIANGIRFANIVLPAFAGFIQQLAIVGSKKGAVDGLANLLAGIANGLSNLVRGLSPFTGALSSVFSTLGGALAALGGPLGQIIGAVASALAPALQALLPAFGQLAGMLGGQVASALAAATPGLVALSRIVVELLPGVTPLISLFGSGLAGALSVVSGILQGFNTFVSENLTWLRPLAGIIVGIVGAVKLWSIAQAAFNLIMGANPIVLVGLALVALVGSIVYAYDHFTWFRDGVKAVFGAIGDTVNFLWHDVFDPAWHGIEAGATWMYHNAIEPVWRGIETAFGAIERAALWLWHHVFDPVWHGIQHGAETFISGFGTAWGKIEGVFKTPVNFMIGTVYDKGIARFWNDVVNAVGLGSLKLPIIPTLAGGGVLPGYSPGHDTVPAMLSPGEGVLTPQAVRAIGPGTVHALNAAYPSGATTGGGKFGGGGVLGGIGNFFGGIGHDVGSFVGGAIDMGKMALALATGNTTAFTDAASKLIGTSAAGALGKIMIALPKTLVTDLANVVVSALGFGGGGGALPGGSSSATGTLPANWQVIASYLASHGFTKIAAAGIAGNVQAESGGNPEAIEIGGGGGGGLIQWTPWQSYGNLITGNIPQDLATQLAGIVMFGGGPSIVNRATSPSNAALLYQNYYERPASLSASLPIRMASANAVYQAMWGGGSGGSSHPGGVASRFDSGGWLQPGMTLAVNQTGQPEPVLSPQQWQQMQGGGQRQVIVNQNWYGPQMPSHETLAEMDRRLALALSGA